MEVVAIGLLLALIKKSVDVVAYLKNRWYAKTAKVVVACVVGVGLAYAVSRSLEFGGPGSKISDGAGFVVYHTTFATVVLLGLALAAGAGVLLSDIPAAIDNTRSSATPPLLGDKSTVTQP